jgi:hypothetical protein
MWLIHFFPSDWLLIIINGLFWIGIISFFVCFFLISKLTNRIPAISSHYLTLQIISSLLLVAGIYYKGGYAIEMKWRSKVETLEREIKIANAKSKEKNVEIVTVYKDKIKIVKQTVTQIKNEIEEKKNDINEGCILTPTAIEMYNKAVLGDSAK